MSAGGTILAWLLAPIDPARAHDVAIGVAWHGRLMVLAWAVLIPIGIMTARFFKITPGQDWPRRLDNKTWWIGHLAVQSSAGLAVLAAMGLILAAPNQGLRGSFHALLGWSVLVLCAIQFLGGWLRGSKGGPTDPAADGSFAGDHYDMTQRRRIFEYVHKALGYVAVIAAAIAIVTGLWLTNAPRWMFAALATWWVALLLAAIMLQRRGFAIDTYQAIWGPDPVHPGNHRPTTGWGTRRPRTSSTTDV
jgi:Eukaryotic cytochrome b561